VKAGGTELADAVAERVKKHRRSVVAFEEQLSDGRWFRISERGTSDDRIMGIITDISEKKDWEGKMELIAGTDALTGLPNRGLYPIKT